MFDIDTASRQPIHDQLKRAVIRHVVQGLYAMDDELPTVRDVASVEGINPHTVERAYHELEAEGFIYTLDGEQYFLATVTGAYEAVRRGLHRSLSRWFAAARRAGLDDRAIRELWDACRKEEGTHD